MSQTILSTTFTLHITYFIITVCEHRFCHHCYLARLYKHTQSIS